MKEYGPITLFGIVVVSMLSLVLHGVSIPAVPAYAAGGLQKETAEGVLIFGGDVMLGREVERFMERFGEAYPFEGVRNIFQHADAVIVNFEAAVPGTHVPTPDYDLRLSVNTEALGTIVAEGVDAVSLANNHSYDFGERGFLHTRAACKNAGLFCIGEPLGISPLSITALPVGKVRVGIFALNATAHIPSTSELRGTIAELAAQTDLQIAYVHWGEEYDPLHNQAQEELARTLIDLGVDVVVGHHPHVVQDIEVYKERPIFYSLGNLIFDQYIDTETERGLLIRMSVTSRTVTYTLVPVSSLKTPSQPQLMGVDERDEFLEDLLKRSPGVERYMDGGALVVPR